MVAHHQRFSVEGIRENEEAHRPVNKINVGEAERWASAIAGTLLVTQGLRRPSFVNLALSLAGGALIYRGLTGHCEAYQSLHIDTAGKHRSSDSDHIQKGILIRQSLTINRSPAELYAFWHDVKNAPRFMVNIESVESVGEKRSIWVASGPFGPKLTWESEVIVDQPDRLIAWKSLPGSDINQAGSVRFEPATGGRGTVVTVEQNIEPPGGILGQVAARLFAKAPEFQVRESLRHFKQLMETGEIPTTEGQSSGRVNNHQIATPLPQSI
jgi:uncharacterized membrane protein